MFKFHNLVPGLVLMADLTVVCCSESLQQVAANFGSKKFMSALLLILFIELFFFSFHFLKFSISLNNDKICATAS